MKAGLNEFLKGGKAGRSSECVCGVEKVMSRVRVMVMVVVVVVEACLDKS